MAKLSLFWQSFQIILGDATKPKNLLSYVIATKIVLLRCICHTNTNKSIYTGKRTENKLEDCPSRELDVAEAEVEVVTPDGQPLHVGDLDVRR